MNCKNEYVISTYTPISNVSDRALLEAIANKLGLYSNGCLHQYEIHINADDMKNGCTTFICKKCNHEYIKSPYDRRDNY